MKIPHVPFEGVSVIQWNVIATDSTVKWFAQVS